MNHHKRVFILFVLISALLAHFWLGSRYPAIDEKAAMAGEVVMGDVLSFEAHFPVRADDPMGEKILRSTGNWILTNRQGMTFGVLLASLVLTLLQLWRQKASRGHVFTDVLKGILIGAPLGVCVNCAAPIAFGMRKQGMPAGISLATMFTSPSLNIIVLTMMFSILPLYMAVTKVLVTLLFLVLILPLLIHRQASKQLLAGHEAPTATPDCALALPAESWWSAISALTSDLLRNLWFIVIRTVPLMLLAGFLGAAMANLLPLDSVSFWPVTFLTLLGVALLGTFAPVPIAFDVVLVQAMLAAGLPTPFAMVLLLTLGMFSIYPLLLVARMETWRFAGQLFAAVAVLGLITGYFSSGWENYTAKREARVFNEHFDGRDQLVSGNVLHSSENSAPAPLPESDRKPEAGVEVWRQGEIRITKLPLNPRSPSGEFPFTRTDGHQLGLETSEPVLMDLMMPFSQGRGIAAADYNADGWPDLAIANNDGVSLFLNQGGNSFKEIPLLQPELVNLSTLVVSFVDIDNNGCLDLFVGAFGSADYFVMNDCRDLASGVVRELAHETGLMTQAAAFADIDRDGDLDLLKGNWFFLIPRVAPSSRAVNYLAINQGDGYFLQYPANAMLGESEITGETLSVSLTDFDSDGQADMIVGNDYMEPDVFYRGTASGEFNPIAAGGEIPLSTLATMSIHAADIDNDLDLDLFFSGKVNDFAMRRETDGTQPASHEERKAFVLQKRLDFQNRYCGWYQDEKMQMACRERFTIMDMFRHSSLEDCKTLPDKGRQDECMITLRIKNALVRHDWFFCGQIPQTYPVHQEVCTAYKEYDEVAEAKFLGDKYLDTGAIDQKDQGNVLLVQDEEGRFSDRASELGVADAYWAWNARFADLDLDEWQDLYVVNGWWLETSIYSNAFFHNEAGQGFVRKQDDFGLQNNLKQHAYVYIDMDRDGDLDIVSRSLHGEMDVFRNNLQDLHSVEFEIRDELGNHFGIGAQVSIFYGGQQGLKQMREIQLGGGFVSFDPPAAVFGLGNHSRIDGLRINWSDGSSTFVEQALAADQRYIVYRDSGQAVTKNESALERMPAIGAN